MRESGSERGEKKKVEAIRERERERERERGEEWRGSCLTWKTKYIIFKEVIKLINSLYKLPLTLLLVTSKLIFTLYIQNVSLSIHKPEVFV